MSYSKRIVCLANSRKLSGRCVAGKELVGGRGGPWVRPVSARSSEELSDGDRRYDNGQDPRLLDVIDIPLLRPAPKTFQSENHVIDDGYYWTKGGQVTWNQALSFVDTVQARSG